MSLHNLPSIVWKCRDDSRGDIPEPRFGQAIVRHSRNSILVHGGAFLPKLSRKLHLFNDLFLLRVSSDKSEGLQWRRIVQYGDLPEPRYGHKICGHQHCLFLFGGQNSMDSSSSFSEVYQLNTVSFVWSRVEDGETESPSWLGCSADPVNSGVFVFGGHHNNSDNHSYLALFDMVSREWSYPNTCGPIPPPRCDHSSTVVKSDIYIHGGCGGQQTYYADLFKLDTTTLTWEEIIAKGFRMTPRAGMTLTAHHSKDLYVFGGYNDVLCPDGGPVIDPLMKYSIRKNEWKRVNCLSDDKGVPDCSYHHSAFIITNMLYFILGVELRGEVNSIRRAKLLNPSDRKTYLMATQRSSFTCTPEESISLHSNRDFGLTTNSNMALYQAQIASDMESSKGGSIASWHTKEAIETEHENEPSKPNRPYLQKSNFEDQAMQSFLQHQAEESDEENPQPNQTLPSRQADILAINEPEEDLRNPLNVQINSAQRISNHSTFSNSENASFSSPDVLP